MERTNKSDKHFKCEGHDEVDRAENIQRTVTSRRAVRHDTCPLPGYSGIGVYESPGHDDSAYQTFHYSSSQSFSKSSSATSCDRFPSEESIRSKSPSGLPHSSKKVHSTLIRIQLGEDKKVSHEWYSEFTNQSIHQQAFSSPLANRSANTSSQFEYDSHIAHMRGKV